MSLKHMRRRFVRASLVLFVASALIFVPAAGLPMLLSVFGAEGSGESEEMGETEPAQVTTSMPEIATESDETQTEPPHSSRRSIRLPAEVHAAAAVHVFPDTGGILTRLLVEVGQYVAAGQAAAYIDPSRPGSRYGPSPVRAPISGTVTVIHSDLGERVATSTPIIRVETLDQLEVRVAVPERYLYLIHPDVDAKLRLPAMGDRTVPLEIARMSPVLTPSSRSKDVTYRVRSLFGETGARSRESGSRESGSEESGFRGVEPGMFGELLLHDLRQAGTDAVSETEQ